MEKRSSNVYQTFLNKFTCEEYLFTQLFFIIIILLQINFAPEVSEALVNPPYWAFFLGMVSYTFLLALIYLQSKFIRRRLNKMLVVVNGELLIWFFFFLFVLGGQRALFSVPYLEESQAVLSLFCIGLYLLGIATYYYCTTAGALRYIEVSKQIRMIIPFLIPYFAFTLLTDLVMIIPNPLRKLLLKNGESVTAEIALFGMTFLFLGICMIFLPYFIQKIWKCSPLKKGEALDRLETVCRKADFKYAEMKTWTVMNSMHTAAIVGIFPKFRYVMFTQSLLNYLSLDELEAVLAHEIGHSKHHHMIKFPFIIMGMLSCAGLFSLFFGTPIHTYIALQKGALWPILHPLATIIPYTIIIGVYFRLVFGYFSRLFERQADLYPSELGIPSSHMISALDSVAEATGGTHKQPSWHHHSIQERIDFLEYATEDPYLIINHHRRVNISLSIYSISLALIIAFLISPIYPNVPVLKQFNFVVEKVNKFLTKGDFL